MTNKNLEQDYMEMQKIKAVYDTAAAQENAEGMEAARAAHHALMAVIESRGEGYAKVFQLYENAMERGNEYIDLRDVIWDKDIEGLINSLRESGIEHFTFSSTWSSAVETAWLFTQNGCVLEGLVEINGPCTGIFTEEYEKVHGYLFAIQ